MKTIAYIEDDPDMIDLVSIILQKHGYRVAGFTESREIIPRLESVKPETEVAWPLDPAVTLTFGLAQAAAVDLAVFDAAGRRVRQLVRGLQPAGEHAIAWDRPGAGDSGMESGIYFCRLKVGDSTQTIVLTRVR